MAVYTCGKCHFIFERSGPVDTCPNCGKAYVLEATAEEIAQYRINKTEIAENIPEQK